MSRKSVGVLAACGIVLAAASSARAHHSFAAAFDASHPVAIDGVVTQIRLENPHAWFFIDATDATGAVQRWGFEGGTPTSLVRSGLKPGFIKVGDRVTMKGWRARDLSQNAAAVREIVLADGRAFAVGPTLAPAR